MTTLVPWDKAGFGPFLPLLPYDIDKLIVLRRQSPALSAGVCKLWKKEGKTLKVSWSSAAAFPKDMQWQPVNFEWFSKYRSLQEKPVGVILMPSVLGGANRKEKIRWLRALWDGLLSGDVLMIACGSELSRPSGAQEGLLRRDRVSDFVPCAFDSLSTYRVLKVLEPWSRAYVCLGRKEQALILVSTRYRLQRRYVAEVIPSKKLLKRTLYKILSNVGIYPWIEDEHILVARKC